MDNKFLKTISRILSTVVVLALLTTAMPGEIFSALAAPGDTTRVSVDSSGVQANNTSRHSVISGSGRFIAFESDASNLVSGDTNGVGDIFVHDRQTGTTSRVSVDSNGVEANGGSGGASISSDGRFVAFYSYASNLVNGDTNGLVDIFVHDRQTGATTRVSVDSSGNEANGNSSDFYFATSMAGNGRYVAFQSEASNLVAGDTNGVDDIFVHDLQTSTITRVSVDSNGVEANGSSSYPVLSSDGRYVSFSSSASNLVAGDTNNKTDAFVHDLQTGQTTRVSVNSSGEQADGGGSSPSISGDGRYVVFLSESNNLTPGAEEHEKLVYVHDRQTGQTNLASVYSDGSIMTGTLDQPAISDHGVFVAFSFYDRGNGQGLQEIFVRDLQVGETQQVTHGGTSSLDSSFRPSLSSDGSVVAFWSLSSILVSGDTNGVSDVFVNEINFVPDLNPSVVSVLQNCPRGCTSAADPVVDFTVTFSELVTGVTLDDFTLTITGSLPGASVAEIIGSGQEYIVAVNTGDGVGTLRLDIVDNDNIIDTTGNPLGGPGAGNGDFTAGDIYSVDRSAPVVTSSLRADPNPTAAGSVRFNVAFSEDVSGVDAGDFTLATTGNVTGTSLASVSGSGSSYVIEVNTGSGDGTLRLDLIDNDSILDTTGNPLGGTGAGNGNYTAGEIYTLDRVAPYVTGSLRADANPTTAQNVTFTVGFSEAVSGVDASDFFLSTSGNISGAAITGVSGSGNLYSVAVATGEGRGMLRLDVLDNDSILDASGFPLGGAGAGNGNFITGEEYTINRKPVELITETYRSNGKNDGWVLESSEDSEQGGFKDSVNTTFVLGDDAHNKQFRSILHFPTFYIPDNAVITRALLMIKAEALAGTDPFTTHGNILVDIRSGAFGFIGPFPYRGLQVSDFQSPSHRDAVGMIENNQFNGWYWAWLDGSAFEYINLNGITQIRLRFQIADNDDLGNDYIRFFSGDYDDLALRPRLVIEYYVQ